MKKSFWILLAALLIGLILLSAYDFLLPFVYRLKEPSFEMPVELGGEYAAAGFIPIRNDDYGEGAFGAKRSGGRKHLGIDIAAPLKTPVYASKSGWAAGSIVPRGYGKLVIIEHFDGYQTRYGHLDSMTIGKKQWVNQGALVGYVGKTGNADSEGIAPHLHFEIRHKGVPIDPHDELIKR